MHVTPDRDPDCSVLRMGGWFGRCRGIVHLSNDRLLGHLWPEFSHKVNMTLTSLPFAGKGLLATFDPELDLIMRVVDRVAGGDSQTNRIAIMNLLVVLKSKRMIVLIDDEKSYGTALIHALSHILVGDDYLQCQILTGHPWWVGVPGASNVLTTFHTRFVTDKILAVLEEASQPENSGQMYFACLSQISPAELSSYFIDVAYQLSHGEIMRIGDVHFSKPVRYPNNMWLLGTMDESQMSLMNESLMSEAMALRGQSVKLKSHSPPSGNDWKAFQTIFLRSCIRSRQAAYHKLQSILSGHGTTLAPLLNVLQGLKNNGFSLPSSVLDHCVIYLANAFSTRGQGLFDPVTCRNLEIASDLAIEQVLLTRSREKIRSSQSFHLEMYDLLRPFPRSRAFFGAV